MKTAVITGSTRGIGLGMAQEFLKRDHQVMVSGRSAETTEVAVVQLSAMHAPTRIGGHPCDVSDPAQVQVLWNAAVERFGSVDYWINNAGISHAPVLPWELDPAMVDAVTQTNLTGMIYGSQVAMRGMIEQGGGWIYNMEGSGSGGRPMVNLLIYQTSKRGLRFFTQGLVKAARETPVKVGYLSPGIVVTDLIFAGYGDDPARTERAKRIFNILADRVETVTPFLVENVLVNEKHGARIAWLTTPKVFWRFLSAPISKRDVFSDT